jgi:hypothetical protein
VFLRGEVDSAWKAKAAARECASVPGVTNVVSRVSILQEPKGETSESPGDGESTPPWGIPRGSRATGRHLAFHADRQPIPQRQDRGHELPMAGDALVEAPDGRGGGVRGISVRDLPFPQHVVGDEQATGT